MLPLLTVQMEYDHGDQLTVSLSPLIGFGLKMTIIMTKLMVLILLRELIFHKPEKLSAKQAVGKDLSSK